MKPLFILASLCLTSVSSFAEPASEWQGKKVPQLILANGKTYNGVTFTKVEPDAVTISHEGGLLRIPMESLKPEAQQALGYDPAKAEESRKQFLAQAAATAEANARRVATEQAEMATKAAAEKFLAAAKTIRISITQIIDEGALGKITVFNAAGTGYEGDDIEFVQFDPDLYSLVDGDAAQFQAVLMAEPFRYTSVLGGGKTVRRWLVIDE